jgi:endoglucanase
MKLFTALPRLWLGTAAFALATSACSDSAYDAAFEPSFLSASSANLEIVSPAADATLSGTSTLRARLTDRSGTSYTMYWQVDGGSRVRMSESGGYHHSTADVSTWSWRGAGPYTISFTAEQKVRGRVTVVGRGSVEVYVSIGTTTPPEASTNPFAGVGFYIDPNSNAKKTADGWRASRPADAAEMDKIAMQPQADWFGGWHSDIYKAVDARTTAITNAGALPVFVAYNIPFRDCGGHSSGGASTPEEYRTWIGNFANGIGNRRAVVVLEPDALAALGCLSSSDQQVRMELIKYAVQTLKAKPAIAVYIDAGHSRWQSASTMMSRLSSAGIAAADGFSLNVSNFIANSELRTYGEQISGGVGGKHFIIDTSRNGQGSNGEWCNPKGRGIGTGGTALTGAALVDAFFWIKRPGESDGRCNGGPAAGQWWSESSQADEAHALGLARRSSTVVAAN